MTSNTLINGIVNRSKNSLAHLQVSNGHIFCWTSEDGKSILGQKYDFELNQSGLVFQISSTSKPMIPELSETIAGFGVVFTNMGDEIVARFYDNECLPITNEIKINTNDNINSSQDEQKVIIDVRDGYLVLWSGADTNSNIEKVWAQRLDLSYNRIGSQFQISNASVYDQFNPSFIKKTDGNFIVVWGMWSPDSSGVMVTSIIVQEYTSDVQQINDQRKIISNITQVSKYIKLIETNLFYHACLISSDGMQIFIQKLKKTLELELSPKIISTNGLLGIASMSNEIAVLRYDSNKIKLQRYYANYAEITTERIVNDDLRNDFVDSFGLISPISNGYMISWNSTEICHAFTMFAKKFIPEPQTIDQDTQIVISNTVEQLVAQSIDATPDAIVIRSGDVTDSQRVVLSKKENRQATVDTIISQIESGGGYTDTQIATILIDVELIYLPPQIKAQTSKVRVFKVQEESSAIIPLRLNTSGKLPDPIYCLMKKKGDKCIISDGDDKISIIKNQNDFTVNVLKEDGEIISSTDKNKDDTISINDKILILGSALVANQPPSVGLQVRTNFGGVSSRNSYSQIGGAQSLGLGSVGAPKESKLKHTTPKNSRDCKRWCSRRNSQPQKDKSRCACKG